MLDWPVLDVAIGLIFVSLILGLMGTAVQEVFASCWQRRAKNPQREINGLLADANMQHLAKAACAHPLITAFAGSLGAPFWFDLLGRIRTVRRTVKAETDKKPASG